VVQAFGLVGVGPVGTAFAVNLSRRDCRIVGTFDIAVDQAQHVSQTIPNCRPFASAQDLVDSADLVFLTTPDSAIAEVCASLRWRPGQAVVHCSGATTVAALESAARQGALVGAIHPNQTFAGREQAVANLPGSTFGIEAEEPLRTTLTEIAQALGGDVVYLTAEDKALYHCAAFIAAGFTYTLVDIATDLWQAFGKTKAEATKAYGPLMQGTVNNIANLGFPNAPTGPITRGDVKTIESHFAALRKVAPDLLPIYKALGLKSLPTALAKGLLSQEKAAQLRALFEGE